MIRSDDGVRVLGLYSELFGDLAKELLPHIESAYKLNENGVLSNAYRAAESIVVK